MSSDEASGGRSGSVLAGLLAPLRLPERVLEALDELHLMRSELTRVREQTEPLAELMPAIERLVKQTEPLSELIPALDSLKKELVAMHKTLDGLQDDVQSVTERLPDPSKGPLQKAHDVLTGGAADPKS